MRMSCYWSWIAHNIVKLAVDPRGDTRVVWIRRLLWQCYKTDSVIVKLLISPFRANLWLNGVFSCNLIAFRFCTLCNFWERMSSPRFWFEGSHDHAPGEVLYRRFRSLSKKRSPLLRYFQLSLMSLRTAFLDRHFALITWTTRTNKKTLFWFYMNCMICPA